jgi:hypothetical protein
MSEDSESFGDLVLKNHSGAWFETYDITADAVIERFKLKD